MLNKILMIISVLLIAACDNVDVSRYPEGVQKCYNGIIYDNGNCTKSKRTIVKYCECTEAQEEKLKVKAEELNKGLRGSAAFAGAMNNTMSGFFMAGMRNSAQSQLEEYAQKLYDECAKKTGYTRIKNCKKTEDKK